MIWQDAVFAVGSVIFSLALVPMLAGSSKPARSSSALTGGVLTMYVATFATLGLWYSACTGAVTAALWWTLWWQARPPKPLGIDLGTVWEPLDASEITAAWGRAGEPQ